MIQKALNNQGVRFILVGLFNTGIDFGIYALLVWFGVHPILANYISTAIAMVISFYINRSYTFKSTGPAKKREMIAFFAVTLFGLWILQPLTILGVKSAFAYLGVNDYLLSLAAKVFATGVSLAWNYALYSRVVFVKEASVDASNENTDD